MIVMIMPIILLVIVVLLLIENKMNIGTKVGLLEGLTFAIIMNIIILGLYLNNNAKTLQKLAKRSNSLIELKSQFDNLKGLATIYDKYMYHLKTAQSLKEKYPTLRYYIRYRNRLDKFNDDLLELQKKRQNRFKLNCNINLRIPKQIDNINPIAIERNKEKEILDYLQNTK